MCDEAPDHDVVSELGALARAHRRALVGLARAEGLGPEDALECVQDAFCAWLGRREEARGEAALATLRALVRNGARNARRRHHRARPHAPIDESGREPAAALLPADELLAHAEDVVRLQACVASLCEVQRAVVALRLLDERSGEDVARALGVRRAYVDVLVHRARASLRVCMRHEAPGRAP